MGHSSSRSPLKRFLSVSRSTPRSGLASRRPALATALGAEVLRDTAPAARPWVRLRELVLRVRAVAPAYEVAGTFIGQLMHTSRNTQSIS